jgi:hydrogenase nickel incorporation protein HypA/HybF
MHELSIAQAIVQIAEAHAGRRRVAAVHVRVGHLRQVVPAALAFAFELTAAGTVAEGAELELEHVPAAVRCRNCGEERTLAGFPLACPACGSAAVDIVAGEELVVDSLELEHELTRSG